MANMIGWLPQVIMIKHYSSLDLISFFLWRKFFFSQQERSMEKRTEPILSEVLSQVMK